MSASARALAGDREPQGLDVLPLPPVEGGGDLARLRDGGLREGSLALELEASGPPDMGQREAGIGGDGVVEGFLGGGVGREEPVHALHVRAGRGGGGCREREPVAIPEHRPARSATR